MYAKWYSVLVGIVLVILGISMFNASFAVSGTTYAWIYLVAGVLGLVPLFTGNER